MMPDAFLAAWLSRVGSDEVLATLADLVPDVAVVAVDERRFVVHWGGDAERLLGWRREQVVGRACPAGLLCDGTPDKPRPRAFGAVARIRRRDGTTLSVRQYAHVFASETGDRLGELHVLVPDRATPEVREQTEPPDARTFHGIVSRDAGMLDAIETLRRVAQTEATVLVRGESGTGKELVARAIHAESRRRDGPFVAVNCGALAPSLLEDELFGHVKGAFTGADHPRPGIFAQANGGTLFLDEVAELSLELQTKLLRVLQERTFVPLGGVEPVSVDVRVVAATHRSLREQVRRGTFREDLMYRVRVVPIFLPPLRDRRVDIDLLLRHAVAAHEQRGARRIESVAPDAMRALLDHGWPGNVRELLNVVEYAFAVGRGPQIGLGDLPPEFRERVAGSPRALPDQPDDAERLRVQDAIRAAGGDFGLAAERLGVSRTTFWRLRRRLGVD